MTEMSGLLRSQLSTIFNYFVQNEKREDGMALTLLDAARQVSMSCTEESIGIAYWELQAYIFGQAPADTQRLVLSAYDDFERFSLLADYYLHIVQPTSADMEASRKQTYGG